MPFKSVLICAVLVAKLTTVEGRACSLVGGEGVAEGGMGNDNIKIFAFPFPACAEGTTLGLFSYDRMKSKKATKEEPTTQLIRLDVRCVEGVRTIKST